MPAFWSDAALMTTSGLLVSAVAVPFGLVARALRPRGEPLLPRWKPWRVPWGGFEVTFAFLLGSVAIAPGVGELLVNSGFYQQVYGPDFGQSRATDDDEVRLKQDATVRVMWASLFALPLQIGMLWVAVRALYPAWNPEFVGRGSFAGKVWLAVLAWLALTPTVLVFHAVVNVLAQQFDVATEQHDLTKLGARPLLDRVLLVLQACVCAAVWEEVFFRGVVLAWCVGRTHLLGPEGRGARPWFVMAAAVTFAVLVSGGRTGPVAFAAVLAIGLALLWRFEHAGARRTRAVYATAALFALGHSAWPSPIPLFLLGLGLGWLAVRTNGVLVPIIVHSLFNAVSVVSVLRA